MSHNVNVRILFIAVKGNLQACGYGTAIYKRVQTLLSYDANKNKFQNVDNIFCEIESPELNLTGSKKYLYFWNKNYYKRLKFDYLQPALSANGRPVKGLWFTVNSGRSENTFPASTICAVLYDYMKYCMQIKNPAENEQYKIMKAELDKSAKVELIKIID